MNAGFAVGHGLLRSVAEKPTMNLQFWSMAELPWEGALSESNFRHESKAQGQHLHTTGRVKLTIPWKRTRLWNKLLCNAPFIIILFFRELITASRMYCEKGPAHSPSSFHHQKCFFSIIPSQSTTIVSFSWSISIYCPGKICACKKYHGRVLNYYPHILVSSLFPQNSC